MLYEISSGDISVKISDSGAEIKSVTYRGEERAWQNDNGTWARTSPILFPVCGNTSVKIDGEDYNIPFHGFARDIVFTLEDRKSDEITFVLKSNEQTFAVYPFEFELRVNYKVISDSIIITNEIKNVGKSPMPFAIGRHDSFTLKKPIGNYKLCFPCDEEFLSQKTNEKGQLINLYVDFGKGKEFELPEDYLTEGQTVIFGGINSDSVTLKTLDDQPIAEVLFDEIRNLLIWRPNEAQMICIEPWSALPDKFDEEGEEFLNKTRLSVIEPGKTESIVFKIRYS